MKLEPRHRPLWQASAVLVLVAISCGPLAAQEPPTQASVATGGAAVVRGSDGAASYPTGTVGSEKPKATSHSIFGKHWKAENNRAAKGAWRLVLGMWVLASLLWAALRWLSRRSGRGEKTGSIGKDES